jgi:hypothetical protein
LPDCNTSKIKEIGAACAGKLWLLIQRGNEKTQEADRLNLRCGQPNVQ